MKCPLGEAPYYETKTNTLRFVDIVRERFHEVNLQEGPTSLMTWELGTPVTFVLFVILCKVKYSSLPCSYHDSTTADIEDNEDEIVVGAKVSIMFSMLNRCVQRDT